jgi:hypothetical protein
MQRCGARGGIGRATNERGETSTGGEKGERNNNTMAGMFTPDPTLEIELY